MNTTDIMLDIETLGTGPNAAILSIGALAFCASRPLVNYPENLGWTFHMGVDLSATPETLRGLITPSTVEWWLQQSDAARQSVINGFPYRSPLGLVLEELNQWIRSFPNFEAIRLWSYGPTFDETIVRCAFERYGITFPLGYRQSRCCRTLQDTAGELTGWTLPPREGLAHNALDDCKQQAANVVDQFQALRAHTCGA